ncbi:MAG: GNAT family N-acetyltransferase [Deltaproteobacteria bacterium]|nr:GNAT family N-acetyltransferase [Deltaproteobacteria bacterium]
MTVERLEVLLATPDDAPAIADMSRNLVESGLSWQWKPAAVARQIHRKDTEVIVARRNKRIEGFAIMRFREDDAHLLLLAVEPFAQRIGIGRSMLAWLEESARVAGTFFVHLEVRVSEQGARQFYRALGYRERGRVDGYYQQKEAAILMTKDLRIVRQTPTKNVSNL